MKEDLVFVHTFNCRSELDPRGSIKRSGSVLEHVRLLNGL